MGSWPRSEIESAFVEYQRRAAEAGASGDWRPWADLFTEDARFVVSGKVIEGRAAIRGYMASVHAAGGRGMHVTTNSLVDVDRDGGTAAASTDYLYVRPSGDGVAIIAAGRYHDRLVRTTDGWRIASRVEETLWWDNPMPGLPPIPYPLADDAQV